MEPTGRIQRLREAILAHETIDREEAELLWLRSWVAHAQEPWHLVRRARATAETLAGLTPRIDPDDLLVGRFSERALSQEEREEYDRLRRETMRAASASYGQRAHMAIDYERLLRFGLDGLREEIAGHRARLDVTRPEDLERDAFYRACLVALDGLSALAGRYAECALALAAEEPDASRREELRELAASLGQVPDGPARTFREALQAVHLVTWALCAGQRLSLFQLGRPDRYLWPLYRRDLAAGRLDEAGAQELVDCLCLMLSTYTARGLAVGLMVGGRDGAGQDVSNDLTRLFLESIAHTRLPYPGIGLCWTPDTPPDVTARASALLAEGLTHPAVFNDEVITAGLRAAGLPPSEACLYTHSTCVEITPIASSNVYVASPYINLVQILHDLLGVPPLEEVQAATPVGGGALPTDPAPADGLDTFEALLAAYERHLSAAIRRAVVDENACQASRYYHGGYPLLSCFVNDCLARGRDIDQGGARHNWIEPSFVGLANLADALTAIRRHVYDEGRLTLAELAEALRSDYSGREDVRRMLLQTQKYGNDDDAVDELAVRITGAIERLCLPYRTYLGGAVHPGLFCWVMHERLGAVTALGRRPPGR